MLEYCVPGCEPDGASEKSYRGRGEWAARELARSLRGNSKSAGAIRAGVAGDRAAGSDSGAKTLGGAAIPTCHDSDLIDGGAFVSPQEFDDRGAFCSARAERVAEVRELFVQ